MNTIAKSDTTTTLMAWRIDPSYGCLCTGRLDGQLTAPGAGAGGPWGQDGATTGDAEEHRYPTR
jgi:hypothetical protein